MLRRLLVLLSLMCVATVSLATPSGALGADPDAPAGAPPTWLPSAEWVMERWLPFDESRLYAALGVGVNRVYHYLLNPAHSLNALARSRGVDVRDLAQRVVGPRTQTTSMTSWRVREGRTALVLSQSHLSQHMLFHIFHQTVIIQAFPVIFGMSEVRLSTLLNQRHRSFHQIAALGGKSKAEVFSALMKVDDAEGNVGVHIGAMSEIENKILRARDRMSFDGWWNYHVPAGGGDM
jgi:hypothetical protein